MVDDAPGRLEPDDASAVIRRATELDSARGHDHLAPRRIDRRALEAAAGEVGISPTSVQQALAEHDAGALGPADRTHSLLGPARARAVRTVAERPDAARAKVDRWLKSQLLIVHRRRDDELEWRPRADLTAKLRRKLDPTARVKLTSVDGIVRSVADAGDGRSVIRLEADLTITRTGLRTGVVGIPAAAGPVLGGAAALVLGNPVIFLVGLPVGAALGGTGLFVARRSLQSELEESQRVLELFLDQFPTAD